MADLFNQDFQDFIEALNKAEAEYILVGGYAVILHGYIRSTADMDVWVNKTASNYQKLKKAFNLFGAPVFSEAEFLGNDFDVWAIGIEPNRIEVLNKVKGIEFYEAYPLCKTFTQNHVQVKYIHLNHLIQAKEAAGRFKDRDDVEQLKKRNTNLS
jgi:hypothetical protein